MAPPSGVSMKLHYLKDIDHLHSRTLTVSVLRNDRIPFGSEALDFNLDLPCNTDFLCSWLVELRLLELFGSASCVCMYWPPA